MTGTLESSAISSALCSLVSMDSRTNARPTPSTRPAAKARTPLRSGLGLEGTLGGCAASPMVRPPLTSGLSTSSWARRSTRAVRAALSVVAASIWSLRRAIASSSDFCSVFCLQVTNAAAVALARAAASSGSGRTAVTLMMSVLGSASAETSAISVATWSFQPSSALAADRISGVTTRLASVCSSRSSGLARSIDVPTATLTEGDCDCAMTRAVAEYSVGCSMLTSTTMAVTTTTVSMISHFLRQRIWP